MSARDGCGAFCKRHWTQYFQWCSREWQAVNKVKQFIPIKKRKTPQKDHVGEAVALLKTEIDQDPKKEFIGFMQEEAELEIVKLILNWKNPATTGKHVEPPNTMPLVNQAQHWQPSGYPPVQSNFQHYQQNLQYLPPSTQSFSSALATELRMRQDSHNEKHFHVLLFSDSISTGIRRHIVAWRPDIITESRYRNNSETST